LDREKKAMIMMIINIFRSPGIGGIKKTTKMNMYLLTTNINNKKKKSLLK